MRRDSNRDGQAARTSHIYEREGYGWGIVLAGAASTP